MELLHRRQYLFAPRAREGWPGVPLGPGVLSHHPELRCRQVTTTYGTWTLLGQPVQTLQGAGTAVHELEHVEPREVRDTTRSWAGRWLLVDPRGRVHLDASGLLGCLFRRYDGQTWASSSSALLARLPGLPPLPEDGRRLEHGRGANWHVGPGAGFVGLDRLLPSQQLDLATGQVLPRPLLPELGHRTADGVAHELQQRLTKGMEDLLRRAPRVWVGLTAGIDSRTMLACAVAAGLPVHTYTQLHDRMSLADRELPPRLAATAGVPHLFLRPGPRDEQRLALYDSHAAGAAQDRDRDFYARGQWDFLGDGDVVVRANAFEVASNSWHRREARGHGGSAVPPLDVLIPFFREQPGSVFERDLARWREWASRHPEPDLRWQDRLYWEQRLGAWAATTEQSLDLLDGSSVVLANCHAVFEALLSMPEKDRTGDAAQRALVAAAAPALAAFPVNPPRQTFALRARYDYATRRGLRPAATGIIRSGIRRVIRTARSTTPR